MYQRRLTESCVINPGLRHNRIIGVGAYKIFNPRNILDIRYSKGNRVWCVQFTDSLNEIDLISRIKLVLRFKDL